MNKKDKLKTMNKKDEFKKEDLLEEVQLFSTDDDENEINVAYNAPCTEVC